MEGKGSNGEGMDRSGSKRTGHERIGMEWLFSYAAHQSRLVSGIGEEVNGAKWIGKYPTGEERSEMELERSGEEWLFSHHRTLSSDGDRHWTGEESSAAEAM